MKIISTGSEFEIFPDDLRCYDSLPAGYYSIKFTEKKGFWLERYPEFAITDVKIYGVHTYKADKVMTSFGISKRNLGVILSGDKGIGKSLFARLLGRKVVDSGAPVIIVDKYIEDIGSYIDKIDQEIMVLFDEFDKTFARSENGEDPQVTMLSLFDGISPRKKLFVVTCNDLRNLNGFMVNRPGRFHYHFRFEYPGAKDIQEYLSDVLMDEYKGEIDSVIEFSNRVGLNYDCLRSIAFELNQGLSFAEAIKDINIVNVEREPYSLKIFFMDGTTYLNNKFYMDSFSEDEMEVELHEKHGRYAGDITFLPYKLQFDSKSGDLFVDAADVELDYETYDDDDKEKRKALRAKTIQKISIHRVFDNRLHYAV